MDSVKINIIPSKSFAHRAYICDFLKGGDGTGIKCELDSDDIRATRGCLDALRNGSGELDCGESGSTLRFILPLVGVLRRAVKINTKGRLSERPMGPLEDQLRLHGMEITHQPDGSIIAGGKLTPGSYELPGSVSSQFITGLLLSLPYLEGSSKIVLTSELKSKAYVDITLSVLADYGVSIEEHDGVYEITGSHTYMHEGVYAVEGDWSQAAFWLVMGMIGNRQVEIKGLKSDSVQGDRAIIEVLRSMGGKISSEGELVISYPSELTGAVADVSEIPDLAPAIAASACAAKGETKLINAGRLRLKESDRIESIIKCVKAFGFNAEASCDDIIIYGKESETKNADLTEIEVDTANDHRIVMMAAVLSLISEQKVLITGSSAVSKSYPTFFDQMDAADLSGNLIRK